MLFSYPERSKTIETEQSRLQPHKVVETPKGLYINGNKMDFVVEDSVSVRYDGGLALVTLTFVAESFEYRSADIQNYHFIDEGAE